MKYAISTMYSTRYGSMKKFFSDAKKAGFEQIDLSSVLTEDSLVDLLSAGEFAISSLHAPVPNRISADGRWLPELSLGSVIPDERREALKSVNSTIDLAARLKTGTVVIHAGHYYMDTQLELILRKMYLKGRSETSEYEELRKKMIKERMMHSKKYFPLVLDSLKEIEDRAAKHKIKVGIETRANFHEVPDYEEMLSIFEAFPRGALGYWHDTGHAEAQSRIGFTGHIRWLETFRRRILGVHLHDMKKLRDHMAPGTGDLDWEMISANLPGNITHVCEIGEWNRYGKVKKVVPFLNSMLSR
ncbi:MAG: sugar phosphate isomerase/epimerase [Elusimicrobia bacterium]|nr:sugar phosphate isomerase/epimerase [Elusimicrobiota bacterium]